MSTAVLGPCSQGPARRSSWSGRGVGHTGPKFSQRVPGAETEQGPWKWGWGEQSLLCVCVHMWRCAEAQKGFIAEMVKMCLERVWQADKGKKASQEEGTACAKALRKEATCCIAA